MMRWRVVRIIWFREVRDQLRDRRTLFMLLVLPVILYPLLGVSANYFIFLFTEKPVVVGIAGLEHLQTAHDLGGKPLPPLVDGQRFAANLFAETADRDLIHVRTGDRESLHADLQQGRLDALVTFEPEWVQSLVSGQTPVFKLALRGQESVQSKETVIETSDDRGQKAYAQVLPVLRAWRQEIIRQRMQALGAPSPQYAEPFRIPTLGLKSEFAFGRIFPFLIVMMSLTGALYPAIDLCAGEKERGTMETLLISPAERSEIVAGKFLTVWLFSTLSAVLNLGSLGFTAWQFGSAMVARHGESAFPLPGVTSLVWGFVLLLPLAGFFSAISLAVAVYARSTREGQYFLMPLSVVTLMLTLISMMPGTELTPLYSLVPITGASLLLQDLVNARTAEDIPWLYVPPVLLALVGYCYLALQWAVHQFNQESVLFREAERVDLRLWVRQMLRDKQPLPTPGRALICFLAVIVLQWYVGLAASDWPMLSAVVAVQLIAVAGPPLVFALLLTRHPLRTLLLNRSPSLSPGEGLRVRDNREKLVWGAFAVIAALAIHGPLVTTIETLLNRYPEIAEHLRQLEKQFPLDQSLPLLILVLAILPAVCEELAFRGFILTGLRNGLGTRQGILISSLFFALAHGDPFRLLPTFLLGLLLALLATRSGSLWPGVVFHGLHNALAVIAGWCRRQAESGYDVTLWAQIEALTYNPASVAASGLVLAGLTLWLLLQPPRPLPDDRVVNRS